MKFFKKCRIVCQVHDLLTLTTFLLLFPALVFAQDSTYIGFEGYMRSGFGVDKHGQYSSTDLLRDAGNAFVGQV